jgi:hypothetical protein
MAPKPFNAAQEAALKTMLDAVRPDADEAAGPSVQLLLHALEVFQHNADNKEKVEALLVQLTKSMRDGASNDDSLKGINACLKDSVTCQIRAICAVEALNTQGGEGEAERQVHQLAIVEELRNNAVRPLCHRMSANNMVAALGASLCSVPVRPKGAQYAYDKIEARKPAKLLGLVTTPAHRGDVHHPRWWPRRRWQWRRRWRPWRPGPPPAGQVPTAALDARPAAQEAG